MALIRFLDLNGFAFIGEGLHLAKYLEIQAFLSQIDDKSSEPARLGREVLALWVEANMRAKAKGYKVVITGSLPPTE
jgi:hypothetical protein